LIVERIRDGRPTLVGASSGAVAGLVAITPCCGFIEPWAAVIVGLLAGGICALAVSVKYRLGFDDSLDVVAVHFVGGWIGSLAIGLFASTAANSILVDSLGAREGLLVGGGATQLGRQALASGLVSIYSFAIAGAIALAIKYTMGFRATPESEVDGIDLAEHAESAYDLSPATTGGGGGAFVLARVAAPGSAGPISAPAEDAEPAGEPAGKPAAEKVG
jgi:Amt family ammonium transporter